MSEKTIQCNFRASPSLLRLVKQDAKRRGRSLNEHIRIVLEQSMFHPDFLNELMSLIQKEKKDVRRNQT
jgi:hypothetical protein